MPIFVFGMNHETAPVAVREQVAFTAEQLPAALQALCAETDLTEAVILSTCNRTEVYAAGEPHSEGQFHPWLVRHHALEAAPQLDHFYCYSGLDAVRHTLRVASGLDSMVVGEPQILGQIKAAYQTAAASGATGKQLNKLMQYAFAIAKQVRTETAIGSAPVSVAYAAVRLARQVHGELNRCTALLVGAGDTIELVAQHLRRQGIGELRIANRTLARAENLVALVGGTALTLEQVPDALKAADILVTATASRTPIITRGMLARAIEARRWQPVFAVDLAVPRNIAADTAELEDVYLYTVDDLQRVINNNLELRQAAAQQAQEIVEAQAANFMDWVQSLDGNDLIIAYRHQVDALARIELDKARRRLSNGEATEQVLEGLARALSNKLIHHPLTKIRAAARDGRHDLIESARELLAIDPTENSSS